MQGRNIRHERRVLPRSVPQGRQHRGGQPQLGRSCRSSVPSHVHRKRHGRQGQQAGQSLLMLLKGETMTTLEATKSKNSSGVTRPGRLFVLELSGDRIHSMNPDGSDRKVLVTNGRLPDGIAVDVEAGHIYWTNMGVPPLNDGSIERADLDGGNRKVIVPQGVTYTPKQLHLDKENG